MKLTDAKIRTLPTPEGKSRKIADGHGLTPLVAPIGLKSWHLLKIINDKEQMIFVGGYPGMALAEARKGKCRQNMLAMARSPAHPMRSIRLSGISLGGIWGGKPRFQI